MQQEEIVRGVIEEVRRFFRTNFPCEHKRDKRKDKVVRARAVAALILSRVTDLTLEEIAGCVGVSVGAIGNVRQRGRESCFLCGETNEFTQRTISRFTVLGK